jgi:CRP/FNR family transcriptional regulator, nitrogen oxide reductase regulator
VSASGIAILSSPSGPQFLEGLAPAERKIVLGAGVLRRFALHSVITNQGHPADRLYLLTNGCARQFYVTEEGKKLLFQWLGPGDLLGDRTVLSIPSTYLVSTEVVMEGSAYEWDRATIRGLIAHYPRLLENALLTASGHITWQLTSHISLACYTARQRVAYVLATLARTIGQKVPGGIALHITNEDLASAANVTPFTASRLISEWQRNRAVVKRRGELLLRSPERLFIRTV